MIITLRLIIYFILSWYDVPTFLNQIESLEKLRTGMDENQMIKLKFWEIRLWNLFGPIVCLQHRSDSRYSKGKII